MSPRKLAVAGTGTMGAGIAQVAAQAGWEVKLWDAQRGAVRSAIDKITASVRERIKKGKVSEEEGRRSLARLLVAESVEDSVRSADLFIEVVKEDLAVKKELIEKVGKAAKPDTILATNTSSLSVTAIAAASPRPENFVGMHFFNPAPVMKLVEVIKGQQTSDATAAQAVEILKEWGKTPAMAKDTPGFIVNRVARPYYGEALRMLGENIADHETIDRIMAGVGGFKMGPFQLMDLVGVDVNFAVTQSVYNAYFGEARFRPHPIQERMVAAGLHGRKTKKGFYSYGD